MRVGRKYDWEKNTIQYKPTIFLTQYKHENKKCHIKNNSIVSYFSGLYGLLFLSCPLLCLFFFFILLILLCLWALCSSCVVDNVPFLDNQATVMFITRVIPCGLPRGEVKIVDFTCQILARTNRKEMEGERSHHWSVTTKTTCLLTIPHYLIWSNYTCSCTMKCSLLLYSLYICIFWLLKFLSASLVVAFLSNLFLPLFSTLCLPVSPVSWWI